ncbi:MAG: carboxypeptidase regulatory-like domain-containing protein [Comamonadaceae bacterium]|nr:MAG: carboxypeptidase regulatory-like domain-containing protein [Comamonadaceae bacterium]
MNGVLVADGTGADKVLDAVTVSVRPDGDAANIEITLKVPANTEGAILSRPFRTSDATVAPLDSPTAEQVAALSDLPTPAQISAFLGRLDACFALPLTRRVSTASSDSQDAIGTAADVVAPECRRLFVGDDPATFTANGGTVGRNAAGRGAWSALFRQGPTGMVHDRGNFEYFRVKDGVNDKVLSYRWTDRFGNTDNETLVVRTEQGELKLTGNSNLYAATVRPVSEDREYLNMPEYNAFTTGYNISIDNRIVAGRSVFDRVEVTPPWSATPIVFRPRDGLSYLVTGPTDDAVTSILRLAAGYANPATAGNLADRELRIPFASPQYDEAMMRALKDQSLWKMEFFPAGGGSSNVQTYRTLSRAQSIAEIRQLKFAQLTAAQRTELLQATATDGRITFGPPSASDPNNIDFSSEGGGDAWEVPAGAIAPTSVSVTGRVGAFGSQRFNDGSLVRNTARKTIIYCVPQSSADLHCVKQPSTSEFWQYAGGSSFNSIELWARTARQVEMKKQIALYKSF